MTLSEHWGAVEADFLRFYRLDLRRALWVDGVGCRRVWDLISGLPAGSAFQLSLAAAPPKVAAPKAGHGGWRSLARRMTGASRG